MSKMSAHTSSTMFCRRYPQVTTSASRKVSSRGRPSPLSHGSSSRSATQHSSSPSCSSSSPDIRSYRNGFSVVERCGVETSFLSAGEAVACYPARRGARFFNMSGKNSPHCVRYGVLHNPLGLPPAESPSEEAPEHDHGIWYSGGWQNRSENPGPGGQYPRLVIEWTTDLHRRGPVTIHAGLGVHEENSSGPGRFGETVTCPSILSLTGKVFYFL